MLRSRHPSAPLLGIVLACLSGCGDDNAWWKDGFNTHDSTAEEDDSTPRPEANSIAETLVQANGAQQIAAGGLIENAAVVGEGYAAGIFSAAGLPDATPIEVRHGFAPPVLPDWPHGIAARTAPMRITP